MADGEPRWVAMIEEDQRQYGRKIVPRSLEATYADEEQARQAAWNLAHNHRPQHPMSPKSRTVVHHDDYNFTVVVRGATQTFHFRVQVGLAYSDLPGEPPEPQQPSRRLDYEPGAWL